MTFIKENARGILLVITAAIAVSVGLGAIVLPPNIAVMAIALPCIAFACKGTSTTPTNH